jgi:hypothetical protein
MAAPICGRSIRQVWQCNAIEKELPQFFNLIKDLFSLERKLGHALELQRLGIGDLDCFGEKVGRNAAAFRCHDKSSNEAIKCHGLSVGLRSLFQVICHAL